MEITEIRRTERRKREAENGKGKTEKMEITEIRRTKRKKREAEKREGQSGKDGNNGNKKNKKKEKRSGIKPQALYNHAQGFLVTKKDPAKPDLFSI